MKFKLLIPILTIVCVLVGCSDSNDVPYVFSDDNSKMESNITPFTGSTAPVNSSEPNKEVPMINLSPIVTEPNNTLPKDNLIEFSEGGITRITYDYNRSEAKVIGNIQDLLPYKDIKELSSYAKDYFNTRSLVLITQTTNSGSIKVSVGAIAAIDETLKIRLDYTVPEIGTADMSTWLLWVEIHKDFDNFLGDIINPATKSGLSTY